MKTFFLQTVVVTLAAILGIPVAAASEQVTIEGGGWGHGIGMSQYGAKALAEAGLTAEQIVSYFYAGTTLGTVGTGGLVGHADPLRIGVSQSANAIEFGAVNGPLTLCLASDCGLTAAPGDLGIWSFRADGVGSCQYFLDETPMGASGPCTGSITWSDQPNTRVDMPGLGRTFARGSVLFVPAPNNLIHTLVEIELEQYLYGLGEMPSSWHGEALQAQAIAGRTYALYKAWAYRDLENSQPRLDACSCHLYSSTQDQKYIGWAKEAEGENGFWGDKWVAAVDATGGSALVHEFSSWRAIQAFDLLFGASKSNLKIIDVPVRYRQRRYGSTNIDRWRHGVLLLQMAAFAARKLRFI